MDLFGDGELARRLDRILASRLALIVALVLDCRLLGAANILRSPTAACKFAALAGVKDANILVSYEYICNSFELLLA